MTTKLLTALTALALLTGCSTFADKGCRAEACKRPDSGPAQLVIWWPPDMRQGLDDANHEVDFTVTPIKD